MFFYETKIAIPKMAANRALSPVTSLEHLYKETKAQSTDKGEKPLNTSQPLTNGINKFNFYILNVYIWTMYHNKKIN